MQTSTDAYAQIIDALQSLTPIHLSLKNESHQHAGYFEGKQSHFRLVIVADDFKSLSLVARHQKIYAAVNHLLTQSGGSVHALAIFAYTPEEWATACAPDSPKCAGKNI